MPTDRTLNLTGRGTLVLSDGGAVRSTTLKSAASLVASLTFIFPADAGTAGYVLSTDGAGNLSFVPPGGSEEFAQVILLGQGPLQMNDADDSAFIRLRAPAVVAGSYTLTFPDALPASLKFVAVDAAGTVTFTDSASTLQTVYDAAPTVTLDATGDIVLTQPTNDTILTLDKSGAGAGTVLDIINDGTGIGVSIAQVGNAVALSITKTDGAAGVVDLIGAGTLSGTLLKLTTPATGSGLGLEIVAASSAPAAKISQATTAADALEVNQATNAIGIDLNKTGAGAGNALDIDDDGTGTALAIVKDGAGSSLVITQNGAATLSTLTQTQNNPGLVLVKTGAGAGNLLDLDNDGTGIALNVRQDGAAVALTITQNGAAVALSVAQTQNASGLSLVKTGAGAGSAARIENDGTGIGLEVVQDGNAEAADFASASGSTVTVLQLTHLSANAHPDVRGTDGNWIINNRGTAFLQRAASAESQHTIAAGIVTITSTLPGGSLRVDTEAAAASDNLDFINSDASDPVEPGTIITVRAFIGSRTIVARSLGGGTGNLRLNAGGDRTLDNADDTLTLLYDGTNWLELAFSTNGG